MTNSNQCIKSIHCLSQVASYHDVFFSFDCLLQHICHRPTPRSVISSTSRNDERERQTFGRLISTNVGELCPNFNSNYPFPASITAHIGFHSSPPKPLITCRLHGNPNIIPCFPFREKIYTHSRNPF